MKRLIILVTVLAASLCCVPQLWAKTFYLKNGEEIEYKSYWQKQGRVYVLINRDTLVDFAPGEVDLAKTAKAAKAGEAKKKVRHKKPAKRLHRKADPAPSDSRVREITPLPGTNPSPAVKAPPAVATVPAGKPAPATAAAKPVPPPVSPKVQTAAAEPPVQGRASSARKPAGAAMVKPGQPPRPNLPLRQAPPPAPSRALVVQGLIANGAYVLVLTVIMAVSMCKVFAKAGVAWWKALIPVYGFFVLVSIAGKPWWWALAMFVPLVNIFFYFVLHIALAKRFSQEALFGVGLALVGFVFFPLLAFGKAEYR
ncbi:MAG TPA: DUF5684 domain-containing protein [Geobacteraceae bacterium]